MIMSHERQYQWLKYYNAYTIEMSNNFPSLAYRDLRIIIIIICIISHANQLYHCASLCTFAAIC